MSERRQRRNNHRSDRRPWGRLGGFLAASIVTIVGVARGLEPDVLLGRAVVAAAVIGIFIMLMTELLSRTVVRP